MRASRRAFLAAAPALAGAPGTVSARPSGSAGPRTAASDPWIEVNAGHARHNVAEIARLTRRPLLAVIKNNGYGAGVETIASAVEPAEAIYGFAVVKIDEAFRLRAAGVRKPILLMGPFDDRQIGDLAARQIRLMVYTPPGPELERVAARLQRRVAVHVCVDTGIGRVGVPYREAGEFFRALSARKSARIEGTMMTFTEDASFDAEQLARFTTLLDSLAAEGIGVGRRHAASSYALFQRPGTDPFLDMVRPGMAVFGAHPEASFRGLKMLDLKPVLALRTRVIYVKPLRAGDTAGYNRAYRAERDTWIATLPVGHADGVPRAAAKGARVRINGTLYPIVASVSASHTIVELGDRRTADIGDVATIFDWEEGSRPEDVSVACGASVYDLLMHLGALLERRIV